MPFDNKKWDSPAKSGDVSGIALYTSVALFEIRQALDKLAEKAGVDISEHTQFVGSFEREINKIFRDMSGLEDDER